MPQTIYQNVDAVDDILRDRGAGARIEIQRDTTSAFGTPTNLPNKTLLAGVESYEIYDAGGAPGNWYRTRITTSTGTEASEWSVFQAGAPTAYATVDALRELLQLPDDSRDNVLADLLRRVTSKINGPPPYGLGFDFFRHPAVSGTEVRTYDGTGHSRLWVRDGIVSLSQVRIAADTGLAYSTTTAADWVLRNPVTSTGPWLSLELTAVGSYPYLHRGYNTVELTGVFGYSEVPAAIEQATLMWAADLYRLGAGGGSPLSATGEEFESTTRFAGGMPRFTWETLEDFRKMHNGALVA